MSKTGDNALLDFYLKHKISPVHQDVGNLARHQLTRAALYTQLGMAPLVFKGASVLEVGPGGGYSALATVQWQPAELVLIEPNPTAVAEIKELLSGSGYNQWSVIEDTLERAEVGSKTFDIVLCEGLIPCLEDKRAALDKIDSLVKPGGLFVLTCFDDVSIFFETMRRLVGNVLIVNAGVLNFNEQVSLLSEAFASHYSTLPGKKRPIRDWVADMILNPAVYTDLFSIKDSVMALQERFDVYHSSPNMFTDYRWYKSIVPDDNRFNEHVIEQFDQLHHNLFHYRHLFEPRSVEDNHRLLAICQAIKKDCRVFEDLGDRLRGGRRQEALEQISEILLPQLIEVVAEISSELARPIQALLTLLSIPGLGPQAVCHDSNEFAEAWGRGQQYVSFLKRASIER